MWKAGALHLRLKIRLYVSSVCSILIYGSEVWRLTSEVRPTRCQQSNANHNHREVSARGSEGGDEDLQRDNGYSVNTPAVTGTYFENERGKNVEKSRKNFIWVQNGRGSAHGRTRVRKMGRSVCFCGRQKGMENKSERDMSKRSNKIGEGNRWVTNRGRIKGGRSRTEKKGR